ncbi:uncharacterized protein [Prorops nasuta]|uniref:uncharacterized protein n=1 Tax=Prorops nasuta TaxID=863751 RepID=UPI0034CDAFC5
MQVVAGVWATLILVHSSKLLVSCVDGWYIDPMSSQTTMISAEVEKRANIAEPTCEELRAMWRYSKRQSRAAETTNELPMYRDPFTYNVWEVYPDRQASTNYRENYVGQPRIRGSEGYPIYGRMVHKAPLGSRSRNGVGDREKPFDQVRRLYGTINKHPPSSRRRISNYRNGQSTSQVPQAGSFQQLKELIRTERAREMQEQRVAEENAARSAGFKEITNGDRNQVSSLEPRSHYLAYQDPRNINYDFAQANYMTSVADLEQLLSRGDQYSREYMLR